jgi:seryl-tRNA synthetase
VFDIKWIRDNAGAFDAGLKKRGLDPLSKKLIELDDARRRHLTKLQEAQSRRNAASKEIGKAKAAKDEAAATKLMAEVTELKEVIQQGEEEERQIDAKLQAELEVIPNLPLDDVPLGSDETDNKEVRKVGTPPKFDFKPKQHFEVGEALGLMDFETAAKISGARFVVLKGALARLERALAAFMLDLHTGENGYSENVPPLLVRDQAAYGTGNLPKFAEDLFQTTNGFWLIPTAEVSLTNFVRESTLNETELPMRLTAWTPCFRSEAGAAGKDTRGMIRQHQFSKVELVSITTPEDSLAEHERMTGCAEEVLKRLKLPETWGLPRRRPTTSKCGCRARTPIGKFRAVQCAVSFKHAAWARATGRKAPRNCDTFTRSMGRGSRLGARLSRSLRITSKQTVPSQFRTCLFLTWVA